MECPFYLYKQFIFSYATKLSTHNKLSIYHIVMYNVIAKKSLMVPNGIIRSHKSRQTMQWPKTGTR
jgi:hypothetical protein